MTMLDGLAPVLGIRCEVCHERLGFGTDGDGYGVEWCVRCNRCARTPTRGVRQHDQGKKMEDWLAAIVGTAKRRIGEKAA